MSIRDWFNKIPTVDGPTKEELRKANARRIQLTGGGSHVERPKRTSTPQLPNYNSNGPMKSEVPKFRPKPQLSIKKNYRFKYDYDYTPFNAPFPPTAEEMLKKGYLNQIPSNWNKVIKEENPVLDLIHSYKDELDNPYSTSIMVKDVLWMLDEIEKTLKEV